MAPMNMVASGPRLDPAADYGTRPTWHLLSVKEVASTCQLSEKAVRRAIEDGELPAVKLRSRLRVTPQDLEAWIGSSRRTTKHNAGERPPRVARPARVDTFRSLIGADDGRGVEL